jgi:hypothetical protein
MKTKSIIAALLLAASSVFAQVPSYVPTNGLEGWYGFNSNVNDESGKGNNGTVNNVSFTSDRFGNSNSALLLNGSTDFSILPNAFFNGTQVPSFTIHCVVKANSTSNAPNIWGKTCFWGEVNLVIGNDNSIGIGWANSFSGNKYSSIVSSAGLFQINTFNTIDVIYQNSGGQIYLNGVQVGSSLNWGAQGGGFISNNQIESVCNFATDANSSRFGVRNTGGNWGNYLNGIIDEFGIWNRALTQQEITALYNSQTCNSSSNSISADGPTTFCAGNSVNLKSDVVGGTYQWRRNGVNITTNATSRTFKASLTGTYTCIATCNGTALTSNAIIVASKTNAFASVTASGATSFCAGDSVILNCTNLGSNYSVQWYRTNISMENATNYSQVVKQPGTYKVVTRNLTNGCSRISGSAITTNVNCRIANNNQSEPTSNDINEESRTLAPELSQGVNLFPNPNNGSFKFTYEGEVEGEGTIQVISAMGQVIYQSQATAEDGRISKEIFLGDQYQKGIYIVRLLINGGQNDSRMIVQ